MRAIVHDTYGGPDVLRLADPEPPTAGEGEVLVRVQAAGLDRGTLHLLHGLPLLVRPVFGLRGPRNPVPGLDLAGVVQAIGPGVTRFRAGDRVFGVGHGTWAELAVARERKLAHLPASASPEQAAALAISGMTALQALRDHAEVQPGQRVLVTGASGGVGSYAVQIAVHMGAEVTGVASTTKLDLVRNLGAAHVVDYTRDDPLAVDRPYDVIVDIAGSASLRRLRRALTPRGTVVLVGGEGGGRVLGGTDRLLRALVWSPFLRQRLRGFVSAERHEDMMALAELVDAGAVTPAVDRKFALADAAKAVRYVEEGHARGKVVVIP